MVCRRMCLCECVHAGACGVCTLEVRAFCKRVRIFTADPSDHPNKLPAPGQVTEAPCASVSPSVQWVGLLPQRQP